MYRYYFKKKFGDVIAARIRDRAAREGLEIPPDLEDEVERKQEGPWKYHVTRLFRRGRGRVKSKTGKGSSTPESEIPRRGESHNKLSANMIRRMDNAPQLVDPSGYISEGRSPRPEEASDQIIDSTMTASPSNMDASPPQQDATERAGRPSRERPESYTGYFPRSTTVEFAEPRTAYRPRRGSLAAAGAGALSPIESSPDFPTPVRRSQSRPGKLTHLLTCKHLADFFLASIAFRTGTGMEIPRTNTIMTTRSRAPTVYPPTGRSRYTDFGGFPGPFDVIGKAIRRLFPSLGERLSQAVTIPRTETLISRANAGEHNIPDQIQARAVPYLRFDTIVGRNSVFHDLTAEKLEELGGVEYRALNALLWIIGSVSSTSQFEA